MKSMALDPSQALYLMLLVLVALERVYELVLARRNYRRALASGGREYGGSHYKWMVLLHALLLPACSLEVLLGRPWLPLLGWPMLGLIGFSMALRYWVITTLGKRWTTRVVLVPGVSLAKEGPYAYLGHPNYVAVVVEIAALPLVHSAWITAVVWSVANAILLRERVAVENAALDLHRVRESKTAS